MLPLEPSQPPEKGINETVLVTLGAERKSWGFFSYQIKKKKTISLAATLNEQLASVCDILFILEKAQSEAARIFSVSGGAIPFFFLLGDLVCVCLPDSDRGVHKCTCIALPLRHQKHE
jgi:hypothetical protein